MPKFEIGVPVPTTDAKVEVEVDANEPLRPGRYIFELQVVDDDGNVSAPAQAVVTITDPGPTAVIEAPSEVPFGESFALSGEGSFDVAGGTIREYVWTLVDVEQ